MRRTPSVSPAAAAWLFAACDPGPSVEISLREEDPAAFLTRFLDVAVEEPADVEVRWRDDDGADRLVVGRATPETAAAIRLLGFVPSTDYTLDVTVHATSGRALTQRALSFTSGDLPPNFPAIAFTVPGLGDREPGLTLLALRSDEGMRYVVMLDDQDRVRWFADTGATNPYQILWDPDGTLTMVTGAGRLTQIDLSGAVLATWSSADIAGVGERPVAVTEFHHDVVRDEDGNFLALDHAPEIVPEFRISYDDPALTAPDQRVLLDRVVRFDPEADGTLLQTVALEGLLDLDRLGYGSLDLVAEAFDWSHTNAIVPRADGGLLLSVRHQDALLSVSPQGDLEWLAAPPVGWPPELEALRLQPVGDHEPFYHQHGPDIADDGTIVLFDNGNYRASPGDGQPVLAAQNSRVVALRVDPVARTIATVWSWEPVDAPVYSGAMGSARWLPQTGGVLATFGYVSREGGVSLLDQGLGHHGIRVVELDANHEVVWQIEVESDGAVLADGWNTFRAERIAVPW